MRCKKVKVNFPTKDNGTHWNAPCSSADGDIKKKRSFVIVELKTLDGIENVGNHSQEELFVCLNRQHTHFFGIFSAQSQI